MQGTIVVRRYDKYNGGYEYVEFSPTSGKYTVGNSAAHYGHGNVNVYIEVTTKKELKKLEEQLQRRRFEFIPSFVR